MESRLWSNDIEKMKIKAKSKIQIAISAALSLYM